MSKSRPPDRSGSAAKSRAGSKSKRPRTITTTRPSTPRAKDKELPQSRGMRLFLIALALLAFLATLAALLLGGTLWYYGRDLPSGDALRHYQPPQITRIVDRNGVSLGEMFSERRTVVPMKRIPRVLVLSVLAAEDADFYHHSGMDLPSMLRVLVKAVLHGRATQGGSTITQQVVKNLLLTPERTLSRKVKELILARRIEQTLSKDEILFLYLSHINFGHGRYGVQEAARFYFGKDVSALSLNEASLIAGIPQSPSRLSPRTSFDAARRRQMFVLDQLEKKRSLYWEDLPLAEIERARKEPPVLSKPEDTENVAPELVQLAKQQLVDTVGEERAARGGFTVVTTLDVALQKRTREALRAGLTQLDARQGRQGPLENPRVSDKELAAAERDARADHKHRAELRVGGTYDAIVLAAKDAEHVRVSIDGVLAEVPIEKLARFNPKQLDAKAFARAGVRVRATVDVLPEKGAALARLMLGPEGASMVVEPRSREVLALVGGYDATHGFNRATQALRQPGSTFKALVYALAIKSRKYTPASVVIDAPGAYDKYKPGNYETWAYEGPVRLRHALSQSINSVAVRMADELGPENIASFARELGITTPLEPSLSLALGASEVRLSELTNAYTTFAAGGRFTPLKLIKRIQDAEGRSIKLKSAGETRDVLTAAEAYVTTQILSSVVEEGTGARAKALNRPAAGKTGTSNQARDAWFVGYTPTMVASVWVGFDDHRPLGPKEGGARSALPVWIELMKGAHGERKAEPFPAPVGIVTARIDKATGLLAYEGEKEAIEEVFLEGTAPTQTARPPDVADPTTFMMEQLGAASTM
ncbi:MAG TPA: PBP1A family penicillin-binding protein [Polyangiales bacterium]